MLTTLDSVPLRVRVRGARTYIAEARPSVEERWQLLAAALWPSSDAYWVDDDVPVDREAALVRAGQLRAAGWSFARISAEIGIHQSTLKDWARRGVLPAASSTLAGTLPSD